MVALQQYKRYGKEMMNPKKGKNDLTIQKYNKAKTRFNKLIKEHKQKKRNSYTQVSDTFVAHNHKMVWGKNNRRGHKKGHSTASPK